MEVYDNNDIKSWYVATYPNDELGKEIYDGLTWKQMWEYMLNGMDIYKYLGVDDSIVRERVFMKFAEEFNVPYDVVYYVWLDEYKKALLSIVEGEQNERTISKY